MNYIFISPNFPHTYWQFCDRLKRNGVNVLGIGDAPYDMLEEDLKRSLTEYYRVDSLENTGWNRMPVCVRTSISRPVSARTGSASSRKKR